MSPAISAHLAPGGSLPQPPSPPTLWVADNWTPVIGGTVVAQLAHYRYLSKRQPSGPNSRVRNVRFWTAASGGWMIAYLGVITAIAVARAKVSQYREEAKVV